MTRTIRTLAELRALRTFAGRRGLRAVVLELPDAPRGARQLESVINRSLRSCGCELGAIFVAVAVGAVAVLALLAPRAWWSGAIVLALLGGVFGMALVGKALGLLLAHRRLLAALAALEDARASRGS